MAVIVQKQRPIYPEEYAESINSSYFLQCILQEAELIEDAVRSEMTALIRTVGNVIVPLRLRGAAAHCSALSWEILFHNRNKARE